MPLLSINDNTSELKSKIQYLQIKPQLAKVEYSNQKKSQLIISKLFISFLGDSYTCGILELSLWKEFYLGHNTDKHIQVPEHAWLLYVHTRWNYFLICIHNQYSSTHPGICTFLTWQHLHELKECNYCLWKRNVWLLRAFLVEQNLEQIGQEYPEVEQWRDSMCSNKLELLFEE